MEAKLSEQDRLDCEYDQDRLQAAMMRTPHDEQATLHLSTGFAILTYDELYFRFWALQRFLK